MTTCCMCHKQDLSTVEGDGGMECQLSNGEWVCSVECYEEYTKMLDDMKYPGVTVEEFEILIRADDILFRYMSRLRDLYNSTDTDWVLDVHHILTEPTCPTVTIKPELSNSVRYRYDENTILSGIMHAIEHVYQEKVLGKNVGHAALFTNPDDAETESGRDLRVSHIENENENGTT